MKIPAPVLLVSVAANLVLGGVLLWRNAPASPAQSATLPATGGAGARAAVPAAPVTPDQKTWAALDAANDAEFVARLRAEGFPPPMLFTLVNLRQREKYAAQLKRFQPPVDYAYWQKSPYDQDALSPEDRAARRALYRQMDEERRQLLGPDADLATLAERASRLRNFGNIPVEKADQLTAIDRDYSEISALIRDRTKGVTLPEDREQLAAIQRERRADLAKVLTPEELMEYDLRSSPSAATVRGQLRNFDPTEEEYRALTHLQLAFDATYGDSYNGDPEVQARRKAAAGELTTQVQQLLGPERFAEYQIRTDPSYMSVAATLSRFNLSQEITSSVVSAQRDLAARYNALRQDRNLAPAERDARLDALSAEAHAKLTAIIGPEALTYFKANGGPINSLLNRRKP